MEELGARPAERMWLGNLASAQAKPFLEDGIEFSKSIIDGAILSYEKALALCSLEAEKHE